MERISRRRILVDYLGSILGTYLWTYMEVYVGCISRRYMWEEYMCAISGGYL